MMYDIYNLALSNLPKLQIRYEECRCYVDDICLQNFENHLREKGEVTVATFSGFAFQNIADGRLYCSGRDVDKEGRQRELILSNILQKGAYLNAYERFDSEEERVAHFSKFKGERATFDTTFTEGQKFKYLNFNNGQLGIPAFGDFTLAFPLSHFEEKNLVFVKYNSLIRKEKGQTQCLYFTENNEAISLQILAQDLSTLEHFIPLIVLKRKEDLAKGTDIDYNLLVLKPFGDASNKHRDYVEVITWQEVKIQTGVRLRAEKERFQALIDAIMTPTVALGAEIRNITELQTLISSYETNNQLTTELV
ncbi:hypothetical protein [Runella zeae]|uniref:hypothetical protein n=1 Tax=Runella zeae TaxID=94255 RepID=UPI0023542AAE|nr:hypothetical protein [Runella zeae]